MTTIRPATLDDVKPIWLLGANVTEFITSETMVTFWPEDILRASIGQDTVIILVAIQADEVAGFIIANRNIPLSKLLIENIYVRPDLRRQGVGAKLIEALIKQANNLSCQFISVLTPPNDIPAIKVYQRAGFIKGNVFLWLDLTFDEHKLDPDGQKRT